MAIAGKVAPTYAGEWSESAAYQQHTYVTYNGDCYISKKPSTGTVPTNDEYWFLALKNITQEQIDDIISGTTTVGNANKLGGETSEAWQTKIDNIQTTSRGTLSQAGWYRVAEYDVNGMSSAVYMLKGANAQTCELTIKRTYNNTQNEWHKLLLSVVYELFTFKPLGDKSKVQLFTKARYTYEESSRKAFIEVYYAGTKEEPTSFTVDSSVDNKVAWQAITPTLTEETVNGVTVTTTYDIPANASPVTDLDIKDNILYYKLTEGFDLNNAFGTYATSNGNITNSLLNKPSTATAGDTYIKWLPTLGTVYGIQVLYNSAYNSSENKYVTTIYIRSYSGSWGDWKTLATTADLANYLPLSGGTVTGTFAPVIFNRNESGAIQTTIGFALNNSPVAYIGAKSNGELHAYKSTQEDLGQILHTGNSAKVAIQSTAPSDTSALWVDTANKVIKAYIDGAWTQVS